MKVAREKDAETIINPAPAIALPEEAYQGLGHLIVNETEAAILSGIENPTSWDEVASIFIKRGVKNVIITLGGEVCTLTLPYTLLANFRRVCTTKRITNMPNLSRGKLFQLGRSKLWIPQQLETHSSVPILLQSQGGKLLPKLLTSIWMLRYGMPIWLPR
jgi:hypothetical protein